MFASKWVSTHLVTHFKFNNDQCIKIEEEQGSNGQGSNGHGTLLKWSTEFDVCYDKCSRLDFTHQVSIVSRSL